MDFIEATVTSVDMEKGLCRCKKTYSGQTLVNVRWLTPLGETPAAPEHGETVLIVRTSTGYTILGAMGKTSSERLSSGSVLDGVFDGSVSRGITDNVVGYANSTNPLDHIPGDSTLRARGGAFLSALVGGAAVIKAAANAQILLSRVRGIIKVFSINFEKYNDASNTLENNVGGRTFQKTEVYSSQSKSRADEPEFISVIGDVEAGTTGGAKTSLIKQDSVQATREGTPVLLEQSFLTGKKLEVTQTEDSASKATVTRENSLWSVDVNGTSLLVTEPQVKIEVGSAVLTLNSSGEVSLECTTFTVNGTLQVNGGITSTGDISNSTISLGTHVHSNAAGTTTTGF